MSLEPTIPENTPANTCTEYNSNTPFHITFWVPNLNKPYDRLMNSGFALLVEMSLYWQGDSESKNTTSWDIVVRGNIY